MVWVVLSSYLEELTMLNIITAAADGIGLALYELLKRKYPEDHFILTQRNALNKTTSDKIIFHKLDATEETDFSELANICEKLQLKIRYCINTIGLLEGPILQKPERRITEICVEKMLHSFHVNSLPILLLGKHLFPYFKKSPSLKLIQLSAKLGSITDNQFGGWHSYRMAKAAGNMALKNLSIELKHYNPSAICIAVHPGTTDTKFTKNYLETAKNKYQIHSSKNTALNIIKLAEERSPQDSGSFFNWDGTELGF